MDIKSCNAQRFVLYGQVIAAHLLTVITVRYFKVRASGANTHHLMTNAENQLSRFQQVMF